jgi:hypothetical protein
LLSWPAPTAHSSLAIWRFGGVNAYGQYFVTLPGRRRLRPYTERDVDDDDDGDEPDDAA